MYIKGVYYLLVLKMKETYFKHSVGLGWQKLCRSLVILKCQDRIPALQCNFRINKMSPTKRFLPHLSKLLNRKRK